MQTIIDADGLSHAVRYYRMFPWEPAKDPHNDMTINQEGVEAVPRITFEAVMDRMIAAAGRDGATILIVAHGEPRGFLMPITRGGVSAMKDALQAVMTVDIALKRRSRIRQQRQDQRASWTQFIEELAPGTIRGTVTTQEAEGWFEGQWLLGQARGLRIQTAKLEELVRKMNEVRRAGLQRVEIRACNMGAEQNQDALKALRDFLGARQVCAPNVGTFYVPVSPLITATQRGLTAWVRRFGGPAQSRVYTHGRGPRARVFDVSVKVGPGPLVSAQFQLRVWEVSRRPHRYMAHAVASDWLFVKKWIDSYVMSNSAYQRGPFYLAGLWTLASGREPYATPAERVYRDALVCVP